MCLPVLSHARSDFVSSDSTIRRASKSSGRRIPVTCGTVSPAESQIIRTCSFAQTVASNRTTGGGADIANKSSASSKDIPQWRDKASGVRSRPLASIAPRSLLKNFSTGQAFDNLTRERCFRVTENRHDVNASVRYVTYTTSPDFEITGESCNGNTGQRSLSETNSNVRYSRVVPLLMAARSFGAVSKTRRRHDPQQPVAHHFRSSIPPLIGADHRALFIRNA